MSEDRFIDIESKLAYQEQLLAELNDAVTSQQAKIMQLDELCKSLMKRLRSLAEAAPEVDSSDDRPPHY